MAEQNVTETSPQSVIATDRRRPGRVNYQNPHLVDLLRRASNPTQAEVDEARAAAPIASDEDPLAAARGVMLGSAIGAGCWIASGLAVWLLL
jgi:hypothetical protein